MEDKSSMEDMEDTGNVIDQLWYTRSARQPYGLRAVSEGLRSGTERWRSLENSLIYHLPKGTNNLFAVTAAQAPISLLFTRTTLGERMLVHKVYTGSGNRATPFIHLLVGLPETMTSLDAINLWRSPFWQKQDVDEQIHRRHLAKVSLDQLRHLQAQGWQRDLELDKLQRYLPFLIQAYLTRQRWQQIFIVAPADVVAYFILALCHYLPQQLLASFTFSTYESDVSHVLNPLNASNTLHGARSPRLLLVGTCPPSFESGRKDALENILPDVCYSRHIVLNYYTERISQLPQHDKISASYADFVKDSLSNQETEELEELLLEAGRDPQLDIDAFLRLYEQNYGRVLTRDEIEVLLQTEEQVEQVLRKRFMQRRVLDLLKQYPSWLATILPLMEQLCSAAEETPSLLAALNDFAHFISQSILRAANHDLPGLVLSLLRLLNVITAHEAAKNIRHSLLQDCQKDQSVLAFFRHEWSARKELLMLAVAVVPAQEGNFLRQLLFSSWSELGDLLALSLPSEWNAIAVTSMLARASEPLSTEIAQSLAHWHANDLSALLSFLVHSSQYWYDSIKLFVTLVLAGYPEKDTLLAIFLNGSVSRDSRDDLIRLLDAARGASHITEQEKNDFMKIFAENRKKVKIREEETNL